MAEKPWYQNGWISFGPFLGSEEERQNYEIEKKRADQPPISAFQDYQKERARLSVPETGPLWTRETGFTYAREPGSRIAEAQKAQEAAGVPRPFPDSYKDWTIWDVLRNPFTTGGEEAYRKARANDGMGVTEDSAPQPGATGLPESQFQYEAPVDESLIVSPDDTVVQPDDGIPVQTNPLDDIMRQKQMIDGLYPQMPAQNIGMDALDAETDKEKQRANYLAQLAFFSGITQGAGGQWEGVGKGLAGAGAAYTSGFDRYQKALAGRAKRQQDAVNSQYEHDTAKTDAAIKLYDADRKATKDQLSENRLAIKERQSGIDEYFKKRLDLAKGNDFTPTDQNKVDQILSDWRLSRERGEIVSTQDVSDQ